MRQLSCLLILLAVLTRSSAIGYGGEDLTEGHPWHHQDITLRGLAGDNRYDGAGFSKSAAEAIAWHADYIDSYLYNPIFWTKGAVASQSFSRLDAALAGYADLAKLHFDDTFSTSGIRANWERYAAGTLAGLYWASLQGPAGDLGAGQNILGVSLHALQDFYSHSSWVDDPDQRCKTWFQAPPDERNGKNVYTGAYETPASGAPKHHGAYSLSCSLLRGERIDQFLDPICTGYSPFQNTSLCDGWRMCAGAGTVTVSANDSPIEDVVFLDPPGIALDTTWLARVQAKNRGLVDEAGDFTPGSDGMHFRDKACSEIVNASRGQVCETDADLVFAGGKDLAIRATMEWAAYLEEAMNAMGPRQEEFWAWLKRESSLAALNARPRWFWEELTQEAAIDAAHGRQYEDFSRLPYQFLAAGPYPVANPSTPDRETAGTANGWYLRVRVKTADKRYAGTDSDIIARVRVDGQDIESRLDYLPTDDKRGRTDNRLLVYDDFERGDDAVYMLGPYREQPESITFLNRSSDGAEVFEAIWEDFVDSVDRGLTSARRGIISLIAGNADYVGTASNYYVARELNARITQAQAQTRFYEGLLHIDGRDEGVHDIVYRMRHTPWRLTAQEKERGWQAAEVRLHKLKTIFESKVDRGSTSDEPFVIFHVAPLNGRQDAAHTYLSRVVEGMDDDDEHVFPGRTGSSVIVKIPPEGGLVISAQVYESDSENEFDREQLKRTFASGFDEETRAPAAKFGDALGRLLGADWSGQFVEAFAFERGAIPHAGPVLKRSPIGDVPGGGDSRTFALDWRKVRPLLSPEHVIDSWQAEAPGPEILDGVWHAKGYECDGDVEYDSIDVAIRKSAVQAAKLTGTPCVGAGEISWKGTFKDDVIEGELWTAPPPAEDEAGGTEEERVPESRPTFQDPAVDPMIGLEGAWIIEWENTDLSPGYALLMKGPGRQCVGEDGCWYRFTRDPNAPWRVDFWVKGGSSNSGEVTLSPSGGISINYGYYHLGHWGGRSDGVATGDAINGKWAYGDEEGREIWRRVRGEATEAESILEGATERRPISEPVTVTAPYVGPEYYMRGNRPTVYYRLYGKDLWGLHYYWLPRESGLEISGHRYICVYDGENGYSSHPNYKVCLDQGGVLGVEFAINVWPDAKPGEQILHFNDQKIAFNLDIRGYPEPEPVPEPGWRPLNLELVSCSTLKEIEPPDGKRPLVFTRSDFRRQ